MFLKESLFQIHRFLTPWWLALNPLELKGVDPGDNFMLKINNRNTKTRCEMCSELTLKIPERRHWRRSGVGTVNFELISHLDLVFLLLTLSR